MFSALVRGADRFLKFLGNIHPLTYLFIYTLCVPTFAAIYCRLDNGFYAPYAQLEPDGIEDRRALQNMVGEKLWNYFMCVDALVLKSSGSDVVWRFHPKNMGVSEIQIDGEFLKLDADIMLFEPKSPNENLTLPINRPFENFVVPMRIGPIPVNPAGWLQIRYDRDALKPLMSVFISATEPKCEALLRNFVDKEAVQMANFIGGRNNDPLKVSGAFQRMTYFSVVAITTLGFGDIVPMTQASRAWVAIEAMLGTVLIGLMFYAVATRARS